MFSKILLFGDAHFGKPFRDKTFTKLWSKRVYDHIIKTIDNYADELDLVAFLGDIVHKPGRKLEEIALSIPKTFPNLDFVFVLGNHDKNAFLNGVPSNLLVARYPCSLTTQIILLPYVSSIQTLMAWGPFIKDAKLILSHNDIYVNERWYRRDTIRHDELPRKGLLVNGHIHRFHLENGYLQLGPVCQTAYKDTLFSVGTALITPAGIDLIKNDTVAFITINQESHIPKLYRLLTELADKNTLIALKTSIRLPKEVAKLANLLEA